MVDIQQFVTQNFNNNITYFQTHHKELFNKLTEYEAAVDKGLYQEKYELIFENDSFDVLEKKTSKKLYNTTLEEYSKLVTSSINYKTDENAFATFGMKTKDIETIIHELDINTAKEFHTIKKFIFFGTGLAKHIEDADKKIGASYYLIVEDDLELFRLSLFVTNYAKLSNNKTLFFSVFDDITTFEQTAQSFLNTKYYYNHFIKFFQMLNHNEEKLKHLHLLISTQSHQTFFYTDMLDQMLKSIPIIQSDYNYLKKTIQLSSLELNQKPFLLIASGPSLQNNQQWLKNNAHYFTIVAVSSSVSFLQKHNISIDIIVSLDGFSQNSKVFENIQDFHTLQDTVLLFSDKINQSTLELFNKNNIFLFEVLTKYKLNTLHPTSPCVGSLAYQLLLIFKVQQIYLLGLDLAIDIQSGKTHTDTHVFGKKLDTKNIFQDNDTLAYKKTLIPIPGNLSKETLTTPHFLSSIEAINLSTHYFKSSSQKVYNLNDGALLQNIIPVSPTSIQNLRQYYCNDKVSFLETFKKFSYNKLEIDEIKQLKAKVKNAKKLNKRIQQLFSKNFQTSQEFIVTLTSLPTLLDTEKEADQIIDTYLHSTLSYIFYFYLTKGTKYDITIQKKVQKVLLEPLYTMLQKYINELNKVIQNA